jgi:hypothetical protein
MVDQLLILSRDECIPLPQMMDEEIASAVNSAHVPIINVRMNAKGTITAITHQNITAEMALLYGDNIFKIARTVDKGIINVEGNKSGESLKIHTVLLVR